MQFAKMSLLEKGFDDTALARPKTDMTSKAETTKSAKSAEATKSAESAKSSADDDDDDDLRGP